MSGQLAGIMLCAVQESTIGAAFLTKTIPEKGVKFEIWCGLALASACCCCLHASLTTGKLRLACT